MDRLDIKKTAIYRALLLNKITLIRRAWVIRDVFLFLSFLFIFIFTLRDYFYFENPSLPFAISLICFSLFLLFLQLDLFLNHYLKKPKLLLDIKEAAKDVSKINILDYLDFDSAEIIEKAESKGGADSYLLLFYLLRDGRDMNFVFYHALIDKKEALRELKNIFEGKENISKENSWECFRKTIKEAFDVAVKRKGERITKEDLFVALAKHNRYLQELLYRAGLKEEDVFELTSWQQSISKKEDSFSYKNLIKRGKLGIEWASGHTPLLDKFSIDWTRAMKLAGFPETVGHNKEGESLERVLSRGEINSAVLVGEPGTGRKSIIQKIIRRSFLGESLPEVNHRRFLELDMAFLLNHTGKAEETERLLDEVFGEAARAGNVILIINDLHNYIGEEKRPGFFDISGILNSYLHLPQFRLVGVTSFLGFRQNIETSPPVSPLLEKVEVKRATKRDTLILMQKKALFLERNYRKLIPFVALKKIISLSDRYMEEAPFPEKALDLLEEALVHINQQGETVLLPEHVERIVSEKTEVPVGDVEDSEKEVLLNLENLLHEKMINQEEAVKAVSFALRRSRTDMDTRKGLVGSFLFLGPTGVGKTHMGKVLADVYFGSEKKTIRIDMSEFQNIADIYRLIGSSKEEGILTSKVREDPFSLILLDEIEKAHPDILNLFLQVLDEGHITDGIGRKISFKNCIIIATSNAGYQVILDSFNQSTEDWKEVKNKILRKLFQNSIFRPEFVNRFDEVVLFKPLTKEDLISIARLQLENMVESLREKNINFHVTSELAEKIVSVSYDSAFGAREMQRAIQDNIGDVLARAMLEEKIQQGESFTISPEDFSIQKE